MGEGCGLCYVWWCRNEVMYREEGGMNGLLGEDRLCNERDSCG